MQFISDVTKEGEDSTLTFTQITPVPVIFLLFVLFKTSHHYWTYVVFSKR